MSYSLIFSTNKSLFSFKSCTLNNGTHTFETPSLLTYIQVRVITYKETEVVSEKEGILYPGYPIEKVYLKNNLLYFVPEESPVNLVYTYAL